MRGLLKWPRTNTTYHGPVTGSAEGETNKIRDAGPGIEPGNSDNAIYEPGIELGNSDNVIYELCKFQSLKLIFTA